MFETRSRFLDPEMLQLTWAGIPIRFAVLSCAFSATTSEPVTGQSWQNTSTSRLLIIFLRIEITLLGGLEMESAPLPLFPAT
jgi:hypothetical protein